MNLSAQTLAKSGSETSKKRSLAFKSRSIQVGNLMLGGDHPIVIQSMTTSDTMDIETTVAQALALAQVGCQLVRITAPTVQDAEALKEISHRLRAQGCNVPLAADIHFLPAAAMIAADYVEKVRINPGNFADRKLFKTREYSESEYSEELERIHEKFKPLVLKLKTLGRALRIGTNHGSLSDRIMNRFGDTPEGMIASAFEFADICRQYDFHNFCFSMKASNVGVMVKAYRMLVERQMERGWDYPIHLGVTEAGDSEDGRMKSAIGIGTLLSEGIGDTIRVSLTEAAVKEIPVARAIAARFLRSSPKQLAGYNQIESTQKPELPLVFRTEKNLVSLKQSISQTSLRPDVVYFPEAFEILPELHMLKLQLKTILGAQEVKLAFRKNDPALEDPLNRKKISQLCDFWVSNEAGDLFEGKPVLQRVSSVDELRALESLDASKIIFCAVSADADDLSRVLDISLSAGSAFVDLSLRAIEVKAPSSEESLRFAYGILQGTRRRMSKTEYISCPSCGRTLFDLEETTARIKKLTSHLKGVKIAVMGCIVNGPGEMADADFGYVGGAPGRVNLYVSKDCVERNIASEDAPQRLVDLIKKHDRWVEPA